MSEDCLAINPHSLGAIFLRHALRQKWIVMRRRNRKPSWYLTRRGADALALIGISFVELKTCVPFDRYVDLDRCHE